tara:strand:+ start:6459 stop:7253 length:795 start_codon:yes stop_codon:yes gene_type:complete
VSVVFAIANQKGGVGKTTTAISLAAALGEHGKEILIVDTDPQANASSALGVRDPDGNSLYDALVEEAPLLSTIVETETPRVSLVPTTPGLAGAEVELVTMMAREFRMKRALETVRDNFDIILMDCPPSLGLLTVNALTAADEVIIPVQSEYFALEGLRHLSQTIELVRRNLNPNLLLRGILLTMFDGRTNLSRDVEAEVRRHFNNTFQVVIPRSVRLSEAPSYGLPVQQYDPTSTGAIAYAQLAEELLFTDKQGDNVSGGHHGS